MTDQEYIEQFRHTDAEGREWRVQQSASGSFFVLHGSPWTHALRDDLLVARSGELPLDGSHWTFPTALDAFTTLLKYINATAADGELRVINGNKDGSSDSFHIVDGRFDTWKKGLRTNDKIQGIGSPYGIKSFPSPVAASRALDEYRAKQEAVDGPWQVCKFYRDNMFYLFRGTQADQHYMGVDGIDRNFMDGYFSTRAAAQAACNEANRREAGKGKTHPRWRVITRDIPEESARYAVGDGASNFVAIIEGKRVVTREAQWTAKHTAEERACYANTNGMEEPRRETHTLHRIEDDKTDTKRFVSEMSTKITEAVGLPLKDFVAAEKNRREAEKENEMETFTAGDLVEVVASTYCSFTGERDYIGHKCEVRDVSDDGIVYVWRPDKSNYAAFNPSDLRRVDTPQWRVEKSQDGYWCITDGHGNYLRRIEDDTSIENDSYSYSSKLYCEEAAFYANANGPHPPAKPKPQPWRGHLGDWAAEFHGNELHVHCLGYAAKDYNRYSRENIEALNKRALVVYDEHSANKIAIRNHSLSAQELYDFTADALANWPEV